MTSSNHPAHESQRMKLETAICKICSVVLWLTTSVIFVILCLKTMLRYATGNDIEWGNEVPETLFPWLVMSGVVLAAAHGSHITTTFLRDRFKPQQQRLLALVVWAVVAMLYGILTVATAQMLPLVHAEKSPILHIPGSVTFACVMLGMLGLFALALKDFITALRTPAADIAQANAEAGPNTHF
jgi:TRAP-type C4-dicarboxylate transport system permease small subunit